MNEELKIIIKAVTGEAKKGLNNVNKELKDMEGKSGKAGGAMAKIGAIGKVVAGAMVAVAAAIVAVGSALVNVSKNTQEYRKSMAQLTTAYQANGSSAEQAKKTYGELYRFMGETDTAVEASNLLSKLTNDEKELAEWTKTLQGVYATFPDSLPIESLVESANETARVGKVTGTLADALNWAGVSEDAFNMQLAETNSLEEREALIRTTLNGLYNDAAELYEKNASAILAQNEAQNRLDQSLAKVGEAAQPLQTALTNLSAALLEMLAPAVNVIVPYFVKFINVISKAVSWVTTFISALTGKKETVTVTETLSKGMEGAASGAEALTDGYNNATAAAEKLKRTTAGFDELNVVSSGTAGGSSGGGSSGVGGGSGGYVGGGIGSSLTDSLEESGGKISAFAEKVKSVFNGLKEKVVEWAQLFTPSIEAWKTAFSELGTPIMTSFESIKTTFLGFLEETLLPFSGYLLEDFLPTIVNSFSTNFAPIFTETMSFAVKQFATDFQWTCEQIGLITEDILQPTLESVKTITTDTFDAIGEEWNKSGTTLLTKFGGFIESIKGIWENFYTNILKPVWDKIRTTIDEIWKEHLEPLWKQLLSFFSKLGESIMTVWNNFLAPIVNWIITVLAPVIVNAVDSILSVVKTIIGVISGVVQGVLKSVGGLLDFITGVFSGNWKKAWQGIKDFFKGIWDSIWSICKGVVNLIIDGINGLWSGIYATIKGLVDGVGKIAGAIGDMLGKNWSFSMPKQPAKIPKLATGGIATGSTLAMIGEQGKEAVLPLENNTGWMDTLADRIASRQSAPSKIVLMLDGKELGYAAINSINQITKQTGELKLAMV